MEDNTASQTTIKPALHFMQEHMARYKDEQYVEGWDFLWKSGEPLPWDKGLPHPALTEMLVERTEVIGGPIIETAVVDGPNSPESKENSPAFPSSQSSNVKRASPTALNRRRKKALVPGCGRGVDVLLLASFGYDAYGLEYSDKAVENCKQEQVQNGDKYPARNPAIGAGNITFVQGDFFEDAWLEKLGLSRHSFDLIYDHTVSYSYYANLTCFNSTSERPQYIHDVENLSLHSSCWTTNLKCGY